MSALKRRRHRTILHSVADRVTQFRQQVAFNRLHRKPPELMWKACAPCPVGRTEGTVARIGHEIFLIGGFHSLDQVLSVIDVFDLNRGRWVDRIDMPANVPQTHMGRSCGEERFIYLIGGQLGTQCHPAVADCFVFDVQDKSWSNLPPLPEPRYSATVQLWNGRLHAISGAKPDRWTSAYDHWSLAVAGGIALENQWRDEVPIPRGGPHRTSAVLNDVLYVFAGQDGDVKPVPADASYRCDWNTPLETIYADSFRLIVGADQWQSISPMPTPRTHCECETIDDRYAVIAGGNRARTHLSDLIELHDSKTDSWSIAGRLPYASKTSTICHEGWLYAIAGQRARGGNDFHPTVVLDAVWRAKFDPATLVS